MKKIKIFIASSAELNEDKQMFDLYFSDKNKLYRDRNIDFDQRTWMDFSSSLNEGRLQDRYNDYIRECDIVIFLLPIMMICVSSSTNNCRFWRMKALSSPIR